MRRDEKEISWLFLANIYHGSIWWKFHLLFPSSLLLALFLSLCTCSFSHSLCAPLFHQLSLFDCLFSLWLFFVNLQNFTRIVLLLTSTHSYTHICIVYIPQRKTVCFLSRDERERALRLRDQIRSFARFTCDWTSHANEKDSRVNGKMLFFAAVVVCTDTCHRCMLFSTQDISHTNSVARTMRSELPDVMSSFAHTHTHTRI